jgi:hypothetical protein
MTASVSIREVETDRSSDDLLPIEDEERHLATTNSLEPIMAHCDRGGSYLRRLKKWQEVIHVLIGVDKGHYGIIARFDGVSVIVPDELEPKLRPLQGQKIAILRFSDLGYSVRVV